MSHKSPDNSHGQLSPTDNKPMEELWDRYFSKSEKMEQFSGPKKAFFKEFNKLIRNIYVDKNSAMEALQLLSDENKSLDKQIIALKSGNKATAITHNSNTGSAQPNDDEKYVVQIKSLTKELEASNKSYKELRDKLESENQKLRLSLEAMDRDNKILQEKCKALSRDNELKKILISEIQRQWDEDKRLFEKERNDHDVKKEQISKSYDDKIATLTKNAEEAAKVLTKQMDDLKRDNAMSETELQNVRGRVDDLINLREKLTSDVANLEKKIADSDEIGRTRDNKLADKTDKLEIAYATIEQLKQLLITTRSACEAEKSNSRETFEEHIKKLRKDVSDLVKKKDEASRNHSQEVSRLTTEINRLTSIIASLNSSLHDRAAREQANLLKKIEQGQKKLEVLTSAMFNSLRAEAREYSLSKVIDSVWAETDPDSAFIPYPAEKDMALRLRGTQFIDKLRSVDQTRSYTIIVDASGSMNKIDDSDHGSKRSRWEEACHAVEFLAKRAAYCDDDGLRLLFFNSNGLRRYQLHGKVEVAEQVQKYFEESWSSGGTNLAAALTDVLKLEPPAKPETLLLITDAAIASHEPVEDCLVEFTKQFHNANEMTLTIVQVGADIDATEWLNELSDKLRKKGAVSAVVDVASLERVRNGSFSNIVKRALLG